jgi:hypothetical protein
MSSASMSFMGAINYKTPAKGASARAGAGGA